MTTETFFAANPDADTAPGLKGDIVAFIKARDAAAPRSQQRTLGPSEVGHPCTRKLAYGLIEVEKVNPSFDPLPAIIGTATHKWLESAAMYANTLLDRKRWYVETRVNIAPWLSGSCDLYDADTATVIDYKVPGATRMKMYSKQPSELYRTQVHLYGKGFVNAGMPVQTVAIMFIPRGGTLASSVLWSEPYDERIANNALERRDKTLVLLDQFDVEHNPDRFEWLSKSGPDCVFCPWFSPRPTSHLMCGGVE